MKKRDMYSAPTDRDYYLQDAVRESGLDLSDPHDWVTIGILSQNLWVFEELDRAA